MSILGLALGNRFTMRKRNQMNNLVQESSSYKGGYISDEGPVTIDTETEEAGSMTYIIDTDLTVKHRKLQKELALCLQHINVHTHAHYILSDLQTLDVNLWRALIHSTEMYEKYRDKYVDMVESCIIFIVAMNEINGLSDTYMGFVFEIKNALLDVFQACAA